MTYRINIEQPITPIQRLSEISGIDFHFRISDIKKAKDFLIAKQQPHRHLFYEITFIKSGSGIFMIDGKEMSIQQGKIFFQSIEEIHRLKNSKSLEGVVIQFNTEFTEIFSDFEFVTTYPFFHTENVLPEINLLKEKNTHVAEIDIILDLLKKYYVKKNLPANTKIIRSYLTILLEHLHKLFIKQTNSVSAFKKTGIVYKTRELINQHFLEHHNPSFYADALFVSVNHLNKTIKESTGKTTQDLINERTVLGIKKLLLHTSLSVSEICFRMNFNDLAYFSRFFKQQTGMSPRQYQELHHHK